MKTSSIACHDTISFNIVVLRSGVMRTSIRRLRNSSAVIMPKPMLNEIGAEAGDSIEITSNGGTLVIAPVRKLPREGWAEDSREIAEAGERGLVWPEFGNLGDEDLEW